MAASNESFAENVHHLNSTTLESFIDSNDVVLLSVVMLPFSKRCQLFVPEYQKVGFNLPCGLYAYSKCSGLDCKCYARLQYHIRANQFSGQW